MTAFSINGTDFSSKLSDLDVAVTHTYAGDIKRTLTGKVATFPTSFRTVGLTVVFIGKITELVTILNKVQVNKVTLSFVDTAYTCTGGRFSCTEAKLERLKDKNEVKGILTVSFVTVGIPVLTPGAELVTIVAPDN